MKIHMVKKGDTLYFIGQKYNVSLEEILKLNPGITNPDAIEVGMKLKIPSGHTGSGGGMDIMHQHIVKQGDTLWKLSKAWGVPLADMIKANPQLKNPNVLLTGEIVNIPKVGGMMPEPTGTPGAAGAHSLHPTSIMQGVQGWVGKLSTAPNIGKTPTGPITGKTPTAPITPVAPVAPVQEKKPTAPIVKPVAPKAVPAPAPIAVEPAAKKPLPIEKPVEKKIKPIHSEYKPNVDLFKQYGIPATEATTMFNLPNAPAAVSPVSQQPTYGGYGYNYPEISPVQTGHGYGGWQQPMPFSNEVSPLSEGHLDPYDCPPGTVYVGSYPSPSTLPLGANPGWGYGHSMVSPMQQGIGENSNPSVAGTSTFPNQGMVSPLAMQPNQGMMSPMAMQPNQGMVSPLAMQPNQGMVSPMAMQPNQGMMSPMAMQPNQGMMSPMAMQPNQGMVSPMAMQPNQSWVSPAAVQPDFGHGYGYGHGALSPENVQPDYEYGYGYGHGAVSPANVQPDYSYDYGQSNLSPANVGFEHGYGHGHGLVSPANVQPDAGYGYGYGHQAAGFPPYPPYPSFPMWPQTAGIGVDPNKSDCGCKGHRSEQSSAKLSDSNEPKAVKAAVPKKNTKKAVIRTVSTRSNKPKNYGNQPWINR